MADTSHPQNVLLGVFDRAGLMEEGNMLIVEFT